MGVWSVFPLHSGLLALLQPLPVVLQGADGVPRLAAGPPQRAVGQNWFMAGFCDRDKYKRLHAFCYAICNSLYLSRWIFIIGIN